MKPDSTIVHPFLTTFATARTGSDETVGRYCEVRNLWVVDGPDGAQPLVLTSNAAGQTSTLTEVNGERDDTDVGGGLELSTHTYVKTEEDDLDRITARADLATSTRVQAEADDLDRAAASLLAVTTKTDAQMERDDTAVGLDMFEPGSGVRIAPLTIQ